ncbi:hypothetical protein ACP70R_006336 [Stipagrostis hirtigluma subsp. patula]
MASHDALWAKLHELELQLAAYKLLRAARGEDDEGGAGGAGSAAWAAAGATCRGRQYEAYMRRRDARRTVGVAAAAADRPWKAQQPRVSRAAAGGGARPMSPRGLRCAARDTQQEVKRTAPVVSVPSTPRRESAALPRSRTVNGGAGAAGSPARPHHQRRNSLGVLPEFGDGATTPRPFLKRGSGTGGAAAAARLRTPRVHDLPSIDVASTPRRPQQEHAHAHAARHARSVSELPLDTSALASPQARPRKRWGSPERPPALFAAADSHRDFSKGLKKLLSFVRKGGKAAAGDQHSAARGPSGGGKPVSSKGWSGCSLVDVPFDRASLEGRQFAMTRAVGISG